jgi:hypothetical protein
MIYLTRLGDKINLNDLSAEHQAIVLQAQRFVAGASDPDEVSNYLNSLATRALSDLPFPKRRKAQLRVILRDLEARKLVDLGFSRVPSYRDLLEEVIEERFESMKGFCEATGLDPGFVSHVLKGTKNLSLQNLEEVLEKIGLRLTFQPVEMPDVLSRAEMSKRGPEDSRRHHKSTAHA